MNRSNINILIGCEESQAITKAFRRRGFNAFSCDLKECSGGYPEYHIKGDVFNASMAGLITLQDGCSVFIDKWHAAVFHPVCTYLTVSANKWFKDQPERKSGTLVGQARRDAREESISFVEQLWALDIENVSIENPIGVLSSRFMKPTQIAQPWQYGHGETKATCLWTRGFPNLVPTDIVEGRVQALHLLPPSKDRAELRSKTYSGIANAIADQWGGYLDMTLI